MSSISEDKIELVINEDSLLYMQKEGFKTINLIVKSGGLQSTICISRTCIGYFLFKKHFLEEMEESGDMDIQLNITDKFVFRFAREGNKEILLFGTDEHNPSVYSDIQIPKCHKNKIIEFLNKLEELPTN